MNLQLKALSLCLGALILWLSLLSAFRMLSVVFPEENVLIACAGD